MKFRHFLLASAGAVFVCNSAGAQTVPPAAAGTPAIDAPVVEVGEVIVTATKHATRIQDVPLTVNVVEGQQLEKQAAFTFTDIAALTPGLSLTNQDGRQQQASIRGVQADLDSGTTPTVDIYFNEMPIDAATAFTSLYDIGQVEIVRGPQGTLRGRSSPSGAILITTRRPSFSTTDGEIMASITNNGVRNYQAAIGTPITDKFAVRVAGLYDKGDDADIHNVSNGRASGHRTWSGRATASWRPSDDLSMDLIYEKLKSHSDQYFAAFGNGPSGDFTLGDRKAVQEGPTTFHNNADLVTFTAKYNVADDVQLNYIGGYQKTAFNTNRDQDIGNAIPSFQYGQLINIGDKVYTSEMRLERTGNHFWKPLIGVYYSNDKTDALIDIPLASLVETDSARTKVYGIFTNQTFTFTPRDTLQAGLRYSETRSSNDTVSNLAPPSSTSSKYHAVTGSASYQHEFSRRLMAYVNYGRGYRPGGTSVDTTAPYLPTSIWNYKPEKSDSFEVGLKSELFDRRLTLNIDAYHQVFSGYISRLNGLACTGAPSASGLGFATADGSAAGQPCNVNVTFNGDGVSNGLELEARAVLQSNWTAQFNASYADAHYKGANVPCNDYNGDGVTDIGGVPRVQEGRNFSVCKSNGSLGSLPKWSFTATSEYSHPIGGLEGFVRGLVNYNGSYTRPDIGYKVQAHAITNAFIGLRDPKLGWELTVFAKNLFNVHQVFFYQADFSLFGAPSPYGFAQLGPRREIGATLKFSFKH